MQAAVTLDQPGNVAFTNLDVISGKVIVRCAKRADIGSIVVKLEGESKTRLLSPAGPNGEKSKPQIEYHKILFLEQVVFPPPDVLEGRSQMPGKAAYTLPQGQHEYPWSFKLPFNNTCHTNRGVMPTIGISGSGLEVALPAQQHVRKTLPPTLSGFPGEAEIRYFVKATVRRNSFFKENPRAYAPFNFFPIEPPRPAPTGSEVYARQRHTFSPFADSELKKGKMKSMFGMKGSELSSPTSADPPAISVDARLQEPAILTCNRDIPLRIIVKRLNSSAGPIYIQSLQVSLIGNTRIRAHDVHRIETNSWVITSKSNMGTLVGSAQAAEGTETVVDDRAWRGLPLPNTVAPSFDTCNISRDYQLDVRVGLSYSGSNRNASKPQSVVLPLRLDTQVFTGIAPPAEAVALLERMKEARAAARRDSGGALSSKLRVEDRQSSQPAAASVPPTPIEPIPSFLPPRPGVVMEQQPPDYSEAPPSYEDAIASQLPPIDAPRPDYAPPPSREDDVLRNDEKKGWVG